MTTSAEVRRELYYKAAAYHEAGHAIVAVSVGAQAIAATLAPHPVCQGGLSYSLGPVHRDPTNPHHRQVIWDNILVGLAGHVAELIYWAQVPEEDRPRVIGNFEGDMQQAQSDASLIAGENEAVEQVIERAFARLKSFFQADANLLALLRVANRLRETRALDDYELRSLVDASLELTPTKSSTGQSECET